MDSNQEQTEGQRIAKAILASDANAWDDFQRVYGEVISRVASKRAKSIKLRSEFSAEDIVNGFMADKLLDRPERMFGPVANGQRPLTPRLLRSLVNYCNSLQRRLKNTVHSEASLELHSDERIDDDPDYHPHEVVKNRIDTQQRVIREAFAVASRIRVPQREILLLSERIFVAEQIAVIYCNESLSSSELEKAKQLVSTLYPWSDDESATPIPMVNDPLSIVWEAISQIVFTHPFGADGTVIADRIIVPRNTWDIWVHRARQRVIASAGISKAKKLFPNWPQSLFELGIASTADFKGAQER